MASEPRQDPTIVPADTQDLNAPSVSTLVADAMQSLSSPLAPIRAEGLAAYRRLIDPPMPGLNITITLALFGSLLSDDDEYVNLGAIRNFEILAKAKSRETKGAV